MTLGTWEIAIILILAGVVFASSLPKLGRFLGKSVFKARKEIENHKESGQTLADRFWKKSTETNIQDRQDGS